MLDIDLGIVKIMNITYSIIHFVHYTRVEERLQREMSRKNDSKFSYR
jgi:hypothetical protein